MTATDARRPAMRRTTVDIITMGCSKNLVDSEGLMGRLEAAGYACTHDSDNPTGDIAVINTCGFIEAAKQESIDAILELARRKDAGQIRRLYVMGCLSERYMTELAEEITQVDRWFGKFDVRALVEEIERTTATDGTTRDNHAATDGNSARTRTHKETPRPAPPAAYARRLTTPPHYAYIKISEGCDRLCSYCAIPAMTGRHVSRPQDDILAEMRTLAGRGVKEFLVIAQELTYYGVDTDGTRHIAELVARMADVPGAEWIKLHYAYPSQFPTDLLTVMRERPNVCKYIDIALQHISDNVLRRMRRHITAEQTRDLVRTIRREVPGVCLRTTLMVGFPGETDEDFADLLDFVRTTRFERLGAFAYSEEDGTYAAKHYPDDVPPEEKTRRLDTLMALQQRIGAEMAAEVIGKVMRVIVDRTEGDYYIARTEHSSPDVDPEVLIPRSPRPLDIGQFYDVTITGSEYFDLFAEVNDTP